MRLSPSLAILWALLVVLPASSSRADDATSPDGAKSDAVPVVGDVKAAEADVPARATVVEPAAAPAKTATDASPVDALTALMPANGEQMSPDDQLAAARAMLMTLQSSNGLALTSSSGDEQAEKAEMVKIRQLLESAEAMLKSAAADQDGTVSQLAGPEDVAKAKKALAEAQDEATAASSAELTEAESMASAAASQATAAGAALASGASAAPGARTHHRVEELTNPDLGPNASDKSHHSMGSLF